MSNPEPSALASPAPPRRASVLLIDDDAAFARSLVRLLSRRCEVVVASDGREGLEKLLAPGSHYDLVLCDLMMPVMNGLELYQRLSEADAAQASRLVFISGGATTNQTAAFLASLPNTQLQKPFETQKLFDILEQRLEASAAQG